MSDLLSRAYGGFICDLDGVVYRGAGAVPHAVEALEAVRASGRPIAYATNNAARPPAEVARHLRDLGLTVEDSDVVNSSQAGAQRVAELVPAGSHVLAVGGPGVAIALEQAGLVPIRAAQLEEQNEGDGSVESVVAVLQGFGPDVSWRDLSQAAFAIQRGALWIATNADTTLPLPQGLAPGNGSLVGAVRNAVTIDPEVVGKPYARLYQHCAELLGTAVRDTLAIGDRLDTDIAGAVTSGMDSIYVMTGVSSAVDVAVADALQRPTYLATDLRALAAAYQPAAVTPAPGAEAWKATCGDAEAGWSTDGLTLSSGGDANQRLRALVAVVWAARDSGADMDAHAIAAGQQWIEAAG